MAFAPVGILSRPRNAPEPPILSVNSLVRSAGSVRAWWNGLPLFWRAQIVGWSLFAIVDLVNQRLIYHDWMVATCRTVLIVVVSRAALLGHALGLCLPTLRQPADAFRSVTWGALLSLGGATLIASLMFVARESRWAGRTRPRSAR